jgi:hypothetical protein
MNVRTVTKGLFFALAMGFFVPLSAISSPSISNVIITNNPSTQNEPMVAINPTDHAKLVVGFIDNRTGSFKVGWSWSDDGGANWTFGGNFSLSGYTLGADPLVAFDNTGTAYLAGLAYNPDVSPSLGKDGSIFLAKSGDGGHTFNIFQKIVAAGSGTSNDLDKPWLYINPANNHIYLAWVKRVNAWGVGGTESTTIWFTRSTDGGTNFSTPIQVSQFSPPTGTNRSHGPQITAVSGTHIYVSWHTIEAGTPPSPPTSPWKIWICESTDGGANFGTNYLVATTKWGYPNRFISMDANSSSGRIYIAYADSLSQSPRDYDVFVTAATAAAGPWTPSVIVSDDAPGSGKWQYWPSLSVATNGRVDVIWYDQRDGQNLVNVYSTSSIDGGTTWTPNIRITEAPGFTPVSGTTFAGDYNAVASVDDFSYIVWMDNRNGNQDIYGARVSQRPVDVMLVLDISGSMLDPSCPGCAAKLQVLKDAVEIFIQLWSSLAVAQPQHQLGVTYFRTTVNEFQIGGQALLPIGPTNTNAASMITDIQNQTTVPTNLTAMGGGLQSAINRLISTNPRRIILFTDGMQNVNPMVIKSGSGVLEIEMDSSAYTNSNISPTTPPTALNQQLNRQISAIGVGATPAFVTLLNDIATATGGKYYLTTAPDDNLRRFFVEQLVDALRGASPQLIDYRYKQLVNGSATESFSVNRSTRKIVFKVSWKRGAPPIEVKNVEKDGINMIGHGILTQGEFYRICAFDLPVDVKGTPVSPEGVWNVQLSGAKSTSYEIAAIADEQMLEYEFLVRQEARKVGKPLQLAARLKLDGVPVTDARTVTATVLRPQIGVGTALSRALTPPTVAAATSALGEPAASPAQKKYAALIQQKEFWDSLQPTQSVIPLRPLADGSYAAIFNDTFIPGTYSVIFHVSGEHPTIGPYVRTETRTVDVEFAAADFAASEVKMARKEPVGDKISVTIQLRPRDLRGNFLGPDYGSRITLSSSLGSADQHVRDLLDGRYESAVIIPAGSDPQVELTVMGHSLYAGPLSGLAAKVPTYRYALSAHVGRAMPAGNFANNIDSGSLFEADAEYRFSRTYSLKSVFGVYNFKPDFRIIGGTLFLRAYRTLGWRTEGYVEAGAGIFKPKAQDIAFGVSAGIGASRVIVPHLWGELGADYWHLFNSPPKINFVGVKAGIRATF